MLRKYLFVNFEVHDIVLPVCEILSIFEAFNDHTCECVHVDPRG